MVRNLKRILLVVSLGKNFRHNFSALIFFHFSMRRKKFSDRKFEYFPVFVGFFPSDFGKIMMFISYFFFPIEVLVFIALRNLIARFVRESARVKISTM